MSPFPQPNNRILSQGGGITDAAFHEHFMRLALREAGKAAQCGEVPTGCVIIEPPEAPGASPLSAKIIARGHNQAETLRDATAHAEMIALTQAAAHRRDWRLNGTILYVTKEPCAMCAGAMVLARVSTLVFGLPDPKRGGVSLFNITAHPNLNHRVEVVGGVLLDECRQQFQGFFHACRGVERPGKPGGEAG